jgi:hypothetical protein
MDLAHYKLKKEPAVAAVTLKYQLVHLKMANYAETLCLLFINCTGMAKVIQKIKICNLSLPVHYNSADPQTSKLSLQLYLTLN